LKSFSFSGGFSVQRKEDRAQNNDLRPMKNIPYSILPVTSFAIN